MVFAKRQDMDTTRIRVTEMDIGWMDIQVRGPGIEVTIEASWLDEPPLGSMLCDDSSAGE